MTSKFIDARDMAPYPMNEEQALTLREVYRDWQAKQAALACAMKVAGDAELMMHDVGRSIVPDTDYSIGSDGKGNPIIYVKKGDLPKSELDDIDG